MKAIALFVILLFLSNFLFSSPGNLLWRYKSGNFAWSRPSTLNGVVFVSSTNNYLYAFNASNGNIKWKYKIDESVTSPCDSEGVVYIGSDDNYLYAINSSSGTLRWRYKTGDDIRSSPCVSDGVVYVGSEDYYLYAINCSDGTLKWRYEIGHYAYSPFVSDGFVYVGVVYTEWEDELFYKLNCSDGTCKWSNFIELYCDPYVSCGTIYCPRGQFNSLYAFYSDDGTFKWEYNTVSDVWSSPYVSDGIVYFGSDDHYLHAINAYDGSFIWNWETGDNVSSTPCVADSTVYFGSWDYYIYALDSYDGTFRWRYKTGYMIFGDPCVSDGVVCFGSGDYYLYAIETYGYKGFKENKSASNFPEKSLSVTPNPFTDRLTISLPSSGAIYSMTGQLVITLNKGKHSLDTSRWREGVYIVKSGKECKRVVRLR